MLYSRSQVGKFLGSLLMNSCSGKNKTMHKAKKISQSIALLRRAKQSQDTVLNMFNALVLPHFTHCSNVWNDGSCVHIEKLHKLHKRAARVMTGSNYETRTTEIFEN